MVLEVLWVRLDATEKFANDRLLVLPLLRDELSEIGCWSTLGKRQIALSELLLLLLLSWSASDMFVDCDVIV